MDGSSVECECESVSSSSYSTSYSTTDTSYDSCCSSSSDSGLPPGNKRQEMDEVTSHVDKRKCNKAVGDDDDDEEIEEDDNEEEEEEEEEEEDEIELDDENVKDILINGINELDQQHGDVDVFRNVGQGLTGHYKEMMMQYWQELINEIEMTNEPGSAFQDDFKSHSIPFARIRKVMKTDEEVKMISSEAPIIFAKACEIFITELTMRAWCIAEKSKRRTLQKNDIAEALKKSDIFDFLIDIVPRTGTTTNGNNNNSGNDTAGDRNHTDGVVSEQ